MKIQNVIENLIQKYSLNFNATQKKVFMNHVETFYDRLINKENVGLELDENIRKQLSDEIWKKADEFAKDFLVELQMNPNQEIDEAEIFLIGTHLSLL